MMLRCAASSIDAEVTSARYAGYSKVTGIARILDGDISLLKKKALESLNPADYKTFVTDPLDKSLKGVSLEAEAAIVGVVNPEHTGGELVDVVLTAQDVCEKLPMVGNEGTRSRMAPVCADILPRSNDLLEAASAWPRDLRLYSFLSNWAVPVVIVCIWFLYRTYFITLRSGIVSIVEAVKPSGIL